MAALFPKLKAAKDQILAHLKARNSPPSAPPTRPAASTPSTPQTGTTIILTYLQETYRPRFRRRNLIVSQDGEEVSMATACAVPTSKLIDQLAIASNAPKYKGGSRNENALPGFFATWARVAWGDLIASLPDEDAAEIGQGEPTAEVFRRMVRYAMLTEVTLGERQSRHAAIETQVERRTLIGWCERFAKSGPWRSIRDKRCWTKLVPGEAPGEVLLRVAIRQELFSQLRADRRLVEMTANSFSRRAERYGVGSSTLADRPEGRRAVVLADAFVADLTEGIGEDAGGEATEGPENV